MTHRGRKLLPLAILVALTGLSWPAESPTPNKGADGEKKETGEFTDFPDNFRAEVQKHAANVRRQTAAAEKSLRRFLENEKAGRFDKSFVLLHSGTKNTILKSEQSQAVLNNIALFQEPPEQPSPFHAQTINLVESLVRGGKLSLEIDDPGLWAYQWIHSTGSIDADFEFTGPFANQFRLVDFQIVRVVPQTEDLAVGWVDEDIMMPGASRVAQLAQYLLRPEHGEWRIWSYRVLDGPRLHSWLGYPTYLWSDQIQELAGPAPEETKSQGGAVD